MSHAKCPHCGSTTGFYMVDIPIRTNAEVRFNFDSIIPNVLHFHEFDIVANDVRNFLKNQSLYCQFCHEYIGKYSEVLGEPEEIENE